MGGAPLTDALAPARPSPDVRAVHRGRSPRAPGVEAELTSCSESMAAAFSSASPCSLHRCCQGVINRVKAVVAGRRGSRSSRRSTTSSSSCRRAPSTAGQRAGSSAPGPCSASRPSMVALCHPPLGRGDALVTSPATSSSLPALFGLSRFLTILAALDTGSASRAWARAARPGSPR